MTLNMPTNTVNKFTYFKAKKKGLSYKQRKTFKIMVNGRSADYIIPNFAIGCSKVYCGFCYISRNQPFGNPLTVYTNTEEIIAAVIKHHSKLPLKVANQCDATRFTYDIGEGTDCLNNELIDKTNLIIQSLVAKNIKPTFATKLGHPSNIKKLIDVPKDTARVRMSVSPHYLIQQLELGSCKLEDRLAGIQTALNKGYEVHLNFSPIVLYKTWKKDYEELLLLIDKSISDKAKAQLKCEVIFLTHSSTLHEESLEWNPEVEKLLWTPFNQEVKTNTRGSKLFRYNDSYRALGMNEFRNMLEDLLPYCKIRYIF